MLNPLQQAKLDNLFRLLDTDHDGRIDRDDDAVVATRICAKFGLDPASPKARQLHARHTEFFDRLCGGGAVTAEEFRDRMARAQRDDEPGFSAATRSLAEAVADACDVNGDGELDAEEFRRLLSAWAWRKPTRTRRSGSPTST